MAPALLGMDEVLHLLMVILAALAVAPALGRAWHGAALAFHSLNGRWGGSGSVRYPGEREAPQRERVLATVLFIDIVGSTQRAAAVGDRKWRELLEEFQRLVRRELADFQGRELDTAGDGVLASFDRPARGIGCAQAIRAAAGSFGIEVRAGLHSGECETIGDKLGGIAVHIGSRVAGKAKPGEILVSQTVKDLVGGSDLEFNDRGLQQLKGVPGEWRVYAFVR